MWIKMVWLPGFCGLLLLITPVISADSQALGADEAAAAAADYQQYCALCHGVDRAGYANDDAPSLRSESLIRSGYPILIYNAVAYGRRGTAMGGFFEEIGGPMSRDDLYRLTHWLKEQVGVEPIDLSLDPVTGDIALGEELYAENCAVCHGEHGEGEIGPAIGNPAMLSMNTDAFLRYALENGRDGTDMPAFGDTFSTLELDAVTAFLRTRATGWAVERPLLRAPPAIDEYVLNPDSAGPGFELKDGLYVKAEALHRALQEKRRMVLLDTRVTSMWQMAHIEGSVPIPYYYEDYADLTRDLPADGTLIVTYCECPRAAAEAVNSRLREEGFKNTAVLWEGIEGWIALGYPVSMGQSTASETTQ